jgi:hypothetical protein
MQSDLHQILAGGTIGGGEENQHTVVQGFHPVDR